MIDINNAPEWLIYGLTEYLQETGDYSIPTGKIYSLFKNKVKIEDYFTVQRLYRKIYLSASEVEGSSNSNIASGSNNASVIEEKDSFIPINQNIPANQGIPERQDTQQTSSTSTNLDSGSVASGSNPLSTQESQDPIFSERPVIVEDVCEFDYENDTWESYIGKTENSERKRIDVEVSIKSDFNVIDYDKEEIRRDKDQGKLGMASLPVIAGASKLVGSELIVKAGEYAGEALELSGKVSEDMLIYGNPLMQLADNIGSSILNVPSTSEKILENADKVADLAGYASTMATFGKLLPVVGQVVSIGAEMRRDNRISNLEEAAEKVEVIEKIVVDLRDVLNRFGKEYSGNIGKIREGFRLVNGTINDHEDRLYGSDRFRRSVKKIVCETILPTIIEDIDERNSLIEELSNLSDDIDENTRRLQKAAGRRWDEYKRREEEINVKLQKAREDYDKGMEENKRRYEEQRRINKERKEEIDRMLNPFYAFGVGLAEICNSIPIIGKPIVDFCRKFKYLVYFGMFVLSYPYLEAFYKVSWLLLLRPLWSYLSWTYGRFINLVTI